MPKKVLHADFDVADATTGTQDFELPTEGGRVAGMNLESAESSAHAPVQAELSIGQLGTWSLTLGEGDVALSGLNRKVYGEAPTSIPEFEGGANPLIARFAVRNDTGATRTLRATVVIDT